MNDQIRTRIAGFAVAVYLLAIVLSGIHHMAFHAEPDASETETTVVSEKATDGIYAHFTSGRTCTQPAAPIVSKPFVQPLTDLVNALTDRELLSEEFRSNSILLQFPDTRMIFPFHSFW